MICKTKMHVQGAPHAWQQLKDLGPKETKYCPSSALEWPWFF